MTSGRRKPGDPGEGKRRKSLGAAGESVARRYLEDKGFRILRANYRDRTGEIDLIAYGRRMLVFCEVKTRLGDDHVEDPLEDYSDSQQERLVSMSEKFLVENHETLPLDLDVRYDLLIVGDRRDGSLEVKKHIADAFRPT